MRDHGRGWVPVVADGPPESQLGEEVERPVEVGHLDVRRAERDGHVGVAAGAGRQTVRGGVLRPRAR